MSEISRFNWHQWPIAIDRYQQSITIKLTEKFLYRLLLICKYRQQSIIPDWIIDWKNIDIKYPDYSRMALFAAAASEPEAHERGQLSNLEKVTLRRLEIAFTFPRLVLQIIFQIQFGLSYQCEIYHRNKWNVIESLHHIFSRKPVTMATI